MLLVVFIHSLLTTTLEYQFHLYHEPFSLVTKKTFNTYRTVANKFVERPGLYALWVFTRYIPTIPTNYRCYFLNTHFKTDRFFFYFQNVYHLGCRGGSGSYAPDQY